MANLVKKWHPDKHPPSSRPKAEVRFKAISEAYEAILDQQENRGVFELCNDGRAGERTRGAGAEALLGYLSALATSPRAEGDRMDLTNAAA
ncbi:hypothetical protein ZEAMMB73_Zm00001d036488 [Zea mays]|uniref:Uncharacterized protein n=1 Tax=Zea mays TaxID=4577 RepID=A0A1D6LNP7_MAIZE|nr:hypothetical protein ZEAMMB73_Zm00001d036488 [Zea mays]